MTSLITLLRVVSGVAPFSLGLSVIHVVLSGFNLEGEAGIDIFFSLTSSMLFIHNRLKLRGIEKHQVEIVIIYE